MSYISQNNLVFVVLYKMLILLIPCHICHSSKPLNSSYQHTEWKHVVEWLTSSCQITEVKLRQARILLAGVAFWVQFTLTVKVSKCWANFHIASAYPAVMGTWWNENCFWVAQAVCIVVWCVRCILLSKMIFLKLGCVRIQGKANGRLNMDIDVRQ